MIDWIIMIVHFTLVGVEWGGAYMHILHTYAPIYIQMHCEALDTWN